MAEELQHRGPDDGGVYARGNVAFGFRRLSILDLSDAAHQPFLSDDDAVAIVFNGEIYNYPELRSELKSLGHTFHSSGDTEVLLHAYLQWGMECLPRLNGMWAFLIHDSRSGRVFGARDRFGVKPLYYTTTGDVTYFASEIKALHRGTPLALDIDESRVAAFIASGRLENIPDDGGTFFRNVRQVEPGSWLLIESSGSLQTGHYWQLPEEGGKPGEHVVDEYRDLFTSAVDLRLRSDVPVGVSLSGGMDSTSIICTMAGLRKTVQHDSVSTLHAFSYMPAEFDESSYIRATVEATGATLHEVRIDPTHFWDTIPALIAQHDEPVHSATAFVGYEIYRAAAMNGVKVVLCGQGADETLAGYYTFFRNWWYTLLRQGRFSRAIREISAYSRGHGRNIVQESIATGVRLALNGVGRTEAYRRAIARRRMRTAFPHQTLLAPDVRRTLRPQEPIEDQTLRGALTWGTTASPLPLYLRLEDRNSMAHSVEARLPFLDYRLVSFAFRLTGEWKMRGEWNKYILRAATRGVIPEDVRTRVDKMGFPTSMDLWFKAELKDLLADLLQGGALARHGFFDQRAVAALLQRHLRGDCNAGSALFNLAQTSLWLDMLAARRPAVVAAYARPTVAQGT